MLTNEQLEIRANGITGSEIYDVISGNGLMVWGRKTGRLPPTSPNSAMLRGTHLEKGVRTWYEESTGYKVNEVGTLVHPEFPLCIATPDGEVIREGARFAALEIKTPTPGGYAAWGQTGTDEIPPRYVGQCLWEAAVLNTPHTEVAVDLGFSLGIYRVQFNSDLFAHLYEIAERFWHDYVLKDVQPPANDRMSSEAVRDLYPVNRFADYITADHYLTEKLIKYKGALDVIADLETKADAMKAELMLTIGDRSGILSPLGRIDYKNPAPSSKTDWKRIAMELGANQLMIDQATTTKPGTRSFRPYWQKG